MTVARPHCLPTLLAVLTAALIASGAAHAFTIDSQSGRNPDGSAKFVDPDEEIENFTSGKNTFTQGHGLFNFNFRPFFSADPRDPRFDSSYTQTPIMPNH
jgi:hypothetical protein